MARTLREATFAGVDDVQRVVQEIAAPRRLAELPFGGQARRSDRERAGGLPALVVSRMGSRVPRCAIYARARAAAPIDGAMSVAHRLLAEASICTSCTVLTVD